MLSPRLKHEADHDLNRLRYLQIAGCPPLPLAPAIAGDRIARSASCTPTLAASWFDIGQHIRSLKMPSRSVSAVFGAFNGERIISTTAIFCLGGYARTLPLHGDATPQVLSGSWVALPLVGTDGGVRRDRGHV